MFDKTGQPTASILGLYIKLSSIMVPIFIILASVGLMIVTNMVLQANQDSLAIRVKNSAAQVSIGLAQYAPKNTTQDRLDSLFTRQLMQTLLSENSVRCAVLRDTQTGNDLITVPSGRGCRGLQSHQTLRTAVQGHPNMVLEVNYAYIPLYKNRLIQRELTWFILLGGLFIAVMSSFVSFSYVVGQPLRKLLDHYSKSRDAAQAASKAKSDFLAKMSHEIRTPVNGIIGMADSLADTPLDQSQKDYAETIVASSDALLSIINDILDFSRVEAGKMELSQDPFDIIKLLNDVRNLLKPVADKKGLAFNLQLGDGIPRYLIGDEGRLRQAILNLVGNALKFTNKGAIKISLMGNKSALTLSVADTGIGIPENKIEGVFSAFEQVDNQKTRKYEGTGLGLAITRQLLDLMGAKITLTSKLGQGSIFKITLPGSMICPDSHIPEQQDSMPTVNPADRNAQMDLSGQTILTADDNATNRKVVATFLKRSGCQLLFAKDGQEAAEMWRKHDPDLILMDISMPVRSGIDATHDIRAAEQGKNGKHVPIIALTANAMAGDAERYFEAGMDDFLPKPVKKAVLLDKIMEYIPA